MAGYEPAFFRCVATFRSSEIRAGAKFEMVRSRYFYDLLGSIDSRLLLELSLAAK